jgi:hypothetical protein
LSAVPTPATKARRGLTPRRIKSAFRNLFRADSKDALVFIAALADVCKATESCFDENPIVMAADCGRREAWLWFQNMAELTEADLRDMLRRVGDMGGD